MEFTKQQVIDKILSFDYKELADWIESRLHGDDRYFPIYEGHDTNLSKFLGEAFQHIKEKTFRENFLEILYDLTIDLWGYTGDQIKENPGYIYELLSLCGRIEKFKRKNTLYRIARSGKLKGVSVYNRDLHLMLLRALASHHSTGDSSFWIEQMKDESNKYYANAAFYALLNRKYRLDILFQHVNIFIDRFKGEIDLVWGIRALIKDYSKEEIVDRFRKIETKLSQQQREAVNHAFIEAEYEPVYEFDTKLEKIEAEPLYKPTAFQPQLVAAPKFAYKPGATLKEKAAEIFKLMGYEVELNRQIAGHLIDMFLKKKKSIGERYECWIGRFDMGKRRVGKDRIDRLYPIREEVREELAKEPGIDDCQALIISEKGFTIGAMEAAKVYGIELKTLNQLVLDLQDFHERHKQLNRDFEFLQQEKKDQEAE